MEDLADKFWSRIGKQKTMFKRDGNVIYHHYKKAWRKLEIVNESKAVIEGFTTWVIVYETGGYKRKSFPSTSKY